MDRSVHSLFNHRCWGTAAGPNDKQMGNHCYYCLQVCQSRYRHKGYTLTSLTKKIGDPEPDRFAGGPGSPSSHLPSNP